MIRVPLPLIRYLDLKCPLSFESFCVLFFLFLSASLHIFQLKKEKGTYGKPWNANWKEWSSIGMSEEQMVEHSMIRPTHLPVLSIYSLPNSVCVCVYIYISLLNGNNEMNHQVCPWHLALLNTGSTMEETAPQSHHGPVAFSCRKWQKFSQGTRERQRELKEERKI